uniref:Uncharacterized protein n=1 Tax=Siphoviridae sp. ctxzZ3 TaxID=2826523 RepID=A0A8S5NDR1_9CAUD|nr:MAG TPA: hypothetical protein [Siphoviridae sp. ctxzZ3]DAJ90815.1 MAG TPA: hypothetical protein [Bacteriophage sp.]DAK43472.1 MAG TPA: hypothetical protein [Caudoviricetes sp.]DAQ73744.1 MAG TPA: hypothetical protein [Caudoviricetes sp.]
MSSDSFMTILLCLRYYTVIINKKFRKINKKY